MPDGVVGSTIIALGMPNDERLVEGGGLVIDYLPPDSRFSKRLVLGFNERGMWIEHQTNPDQSLSGDVALSKDSQSGCVSLMFITIE
jgi:hypothetical protein